MAGEGGGERSREASTMGGGGASPLLGVAHKALRARPRGGTRGGGGDPPSLGHRSRGARVTLPRPPPPARPCAPSCPQDFLQGDCSKARQKLSWKPRVAFDVSESPVLRPGGRGPGGGEGWTARRAGAGGPGVPLTRAHALPAGAGARDGGGRRGAHEDQPQRLSARRGPGQPRFAAAGKGPADSFSSDRFWNHDVLITYLLHLKLYPRQLRLWGFQMVFLFSY